MTPAEKQKAYRDRKRARLSESEAMPDTAKELRKERAQADIEAFNALLDEAIDFIGEMRDNLDNRDGAESVFAAYKDAIERLTDAYGFALKADLYGG